VVADATTCFNEAAERALRVRRPGMDKNAESTILGINALAKRAGGIAAIQGYRRHQKMRQRMQEDIRAAREIAIAVALGLPGIETAHQTINPLYNLGPPKSRSKKSGFMSNKMAWSSVGA
jgi:hypothetical protein